MPGEKRPLGKRRARVFRNGDTDLIRKPDSTRDLAAGISIEALPEEDRDIVTNALTLAEEQKRRVYFRRESMRTTDREALQSIFTKLKETKGIELTLQKYQIVLIYAALDHTNLRDARRLRLHHTAGLIAAAVEEAKLELFGEEPDNSPNIGEMNPDIIADSYRIAKLEHSANHDSLTGLMNNREDIRNRFRVERDRFMREAAPDEVMLVVEMDLAKLKSLNDRYGRTGVDDEIFKPLGQAFNKAFRGNDIRARLGGDEFTLVFSRVPRTAIQNVLDNIQKIVRDCPFGPKINKDDVKFRMGVAALDRAELEHIPLHHVDTGIKAIRHKAAVAEAAVKRAMSNGSTEMVKVWDPSLAADHSAPTGEPGQTWEIVREFIERTNVSVVEEIRRTYGDNIAARYEKI